MSDRLKHAFEEVSKLSEGDQDRFAELILEELRDEAGWQRRFASGEGALAALAREARTEREEERTVPADEFLF